MAAAIAGSRLLAEASADEYTFRFNRRTSGPRRLLFLRLMQQAVDLNPVPAKELLGGKRFQMAPTNGLNLSQAHSHIL
jgi:hypothetical protein